MGLIALVYVSVASRPLSDDDLKAILATSRENNKMLGITGMLLYRDDFFIQALEGEEDVVVPLYDKIAKDERHTNVLLVYKTNIDGRSFPSWSMGFNKISDAAVSQMSGFNDFLLDKHDMTYFTEQPSRASRLLETFKDRTYF